MVDLQQQQQTVRLYRTFREAITETFFFGTIVPNVGGWVWMDFYGIFDPFLTEISGKFAVKITFCVPNLSFSGGGSAVGGFISLVQLYQINPFLRASPPVSRFLRNLSGVLISGLYDSTIPSSRQCMLPLQIILIMMRNITFFHH